MNIHEKYFHINIKLYLLNNATFDQAINDSFTNLLNKEFNEMNNIQILSTFCDNILMKVVMMMFNFFKLRIIPLSFKLFHYLAHDYINLLKSCVEIFEATSMVIGTIGTDENDLEVATG